jgi:hypothetical protein
MHYYEYDIDQLQKEQQQEAYAHHCQERWEQGYEDATTQVWNCCQTKSVDCSRYCNYLAGYLWGLEQKTIQYHAECSSNLAVLDSEDEGEF